MLLTKEGREGGFLISVIFVDSVFVEDVKALGYSFVDKEVCRLLSEQGATFFCLLDSLL